MFIGVTVPEVRKIAVRHLDLEPSDLQLLLSSPVHEDRLLAALILVKKYEKPINDSSKAGVVRFYLKNRMGINNWDLVDLTAAKILGHSCFISHDDSDILTLAKSKRHWDRRIAMVATYAYIRAGDLRLTFLLAKKFLQDPEDLMHKATGWMLREAGKKDVDILRNFIKKQGKSMPRTMLRYAIEKFDEKERKSLLKRSKT